MFVWLAEDDRPAVDAQGDPAVGRRAVLEGVEDGPELLVHALERLPLQPETLFQQVAAMDPDRAAAELPAVEGHVVLEGASAARRVLRRRVRRVARGGHEERFILRQDAAERVVRGVPAPFSSSHWYIGKRVTQT